MVMQVFLNNKWQYVFCANPRFDEPITTDKKEKAIKWHSHSIGYFTRKFGNLQFRGV
jgi:hypothetical protein